MLEEDLDKERFFALVRRTYWQAAEGSTTRGLMQTLIGQLDFLRWTTANPASTSTPATKPSAASSRSREATFTPGVLSEIGSFGGLFQLDRSAYDEPVLVSSADGVGTKLKVAFMTGRHDTIGARSGEPLRQRHPGAGRPAAVLSRLPGDRPAVA